MPTFDILPNRHLKDTDPSLGSLAEVTFEWSEATKNSKYFVTFDNDPNVPKPHVCVRMPRKGSGG
jgi:hypothetical protein